MFDLTEFSQLPNLTIGLETFKHCTWLQLTTTCVLCLFQVNSEATSVLMQIIKDTNICLPPAAADVLSAPGNIEYSGSVIFWAFSALPPNSCTLFAEVVLVKGIGRSKSCMTWTVSGAKILKWKLMPGDTPFEQIDYWRLVGWSVTLSYVSRTTRCNCCWVFP